MEKSGVDYIRNRAGGQRNKRDVKSRTMNRFIVFDEDIASQYDYDDESNVPLRPETERSRLEKKVQKRRDMQLNRNLKGNGTREIVHIITIKNAAKAGKDYVLKILLNAVEGIRPIAPRINQSNIEFFLDNQDDAEAVRSMSRRIVDKKIGRLQIYIQRANAPWETLKSSVKTLIESVVRKRYSSVSNSLDLSDFANDKEFLNANVHCALFNNAIVVYVSNIISRFFSEIQGLSLKSNRLRLLDYVSTLVYSAPSVVELDLSSNALTRIEELDRIRGWKIERLHLENNECVLRFDASSYASAIHNYFPRVNYLNGCFVTQNPFKIKADENDDFLLPYKLGFSPDENVQKHVELFLLEFLNLYDGPNGYETRKTLMNAYDDSAVLTFAIHRLRDSFATKYSNYSPKGDEETYTTYIRSSHNILFETKWTNYRDKIIYKGSMDVAVALSKLPLTNHIKESFILDFNLITNEYVSFTLQGLIRDGPDAFKTDGDCKFFIRNFVVVPKPSNKMAIVSDMLTLTPISSERMERYIDLLKKGALQDLDKEPSTSLSVKMPSLSNLNTVASASELFNQMGSISDSKNYVQAPPSTPQPPNNQLENISSNSYDINDPAIQQAMIQQFSAISKMKLEWSEKCLSDCQWDFEAAGQAFNEMYSRNQIPPDAFT